MFQAPVTPTSRMRLHASLAAALAAALSACAAPASPVLYDVGLDTVERPADAATRYGEFTVSQQDVEDEERYVFEDDLIEVAWLYTPTQLAFSLQNKTDHTVRIVWDDAAYIDPDGRSGRVMHTGVKYVDRNNSMPPSVVARRSTIEDIVVPVDNIGGGVGSPLGWYTDPLLLPRYLSGDATADDALANRDKTFSVLLPIQVEDVTNDYVFTFRVLDVEVPTAE